jgi:hypothetical protein
VSTIIERPWFITAHAFKRMAEMSLDRLQVVEVIGEPEISYVSLQDLTCRVYCRDQLTVVANPTARMIVTVLWRNHHEEWTSPRLTVPQRSALEVLAATRRSSGMTVKEVGIPGPVLKRLAHMGLTRTTLGGRWYITTQGREAIAWWLDSSKQTC